MAESEAAAQARINTLVNNVIDPADTPPGIDPTAWKYVLNFTMRHEGPVDFLYKDDGGGDVAAQKVTCGIGLLLSSESDAANNAGSFVGLTGQAAQPTDMIADWRAANGLDRTTAPSNLFTYATITDMRLSWDSMVGLLISKMTSSFNDMLTNPNYGGAFDDFFHFPLEAQVACTSFAYGGFLGVFKNMRAAIKAGRFDRLAPPGNANGAAEECHVVGRNETKNNAHRTLFENASRVKRGERDDGLPLDFKNPFRF